MESQTRSPHSGRSSCQKPAHLRIFVVENHEDTRILLCMLLEQMGHTVYSAASMRDALRAIPASGCDVLISDIGLPDGDGWELMERLAGQRPPLAIAMSGRGMSGDRARSHSVGFQHHLVKPTGPEQLAQILEGERRVRTERQTEAA